MFDDPGVISAITPWWYFWTEPRHHGMRWSMCAKEVCFKNELLRCVGVCKGCGCSCRRGLAFRTGARGGHGGCLLCKQPRGQTCAWEWGER